MHLEVQEFLVKEDREPLAHLASAEMQCPMEYGYRKIESVVEEWAELTGGIEVPMY